MEKYSVQYETKYDPIIFKHSRHVNQQERHWNLYDHSWHASIKLELSGSRNAKTHEMTFIMHLKHQITNCNQLKLILLRISVSFPTDQHFGIYVLKAANKYSKSDHSDQTLWFPFLKIIIPVILWFFSPLSKVSSDRSQEATIIKGQFIPRTKGQASHNRHQG